MSQYKKVNKFNPNKYAIEKLPLITKLTIHCDLFLDFQLCNDCGDWKFIAKQQFPWRQIDREAKWEVLIYFEISNNEFELKYQKIRASHLLMWQSCFCLNNGSYGMDSARCWSSFIGKLSSHVLVLFVNDLCSCRAWRLQHIP